MPPGRKEQDVLARQKQLAAMLAAKRKTSQTHSKTNGAASSSTTSSSKRPRIRSRPSKPSTPSVIDLTNDSKKAPPSGNGKGKKVIMGIHKSFKRQSASSVMAAARAKAMRQKDGEITEANPNDSSDQKRRKESAKKNADSNTDGSKVKAAAKKRLASLVQNASTVPSGNQDDWAMAKSNITPEDFWKNIRKWDFVSQLANLQLENRDETKDKDQYNKVVPDRFINARHYVSVWAPLCLAYLGIDQLQLFDVHDFQQLLYAPLRFLYWWSPESYSTMSNHDVLDGSHHYVDLIESLQIFLLPTKDEETSVNFVDWNLPMFSLRILVLILLMGCHIAEKALVYASWGDWLVIVFCLIVGLFTTTQFWNQRWRKSNHNFATLY